MGNRIEFLGSEIDVLGINQSLKVIEDIIREKRKVQHVVLNASKVVSLQNDQRLQKVINSCGMINADGQAIVWASRFLGKPLPERVAGIDLMYKLVELSAAKGYSIYFLGAKEDVVKSTVENFKLNYPTLRVAGFRNGYWKKSEEKSVIQLIKKSKADILFVAISSPKKEYFLGEYMEELEIPFCMGVGGSFDVVAGLTKRAPLWMQKAGLEWFYRLIQEPKRMWKRYLIGNFKFILLVLKERYNTSKLK
ncbi:MAG: WecB/TagA/CpsF family glycosyltransferase [Bacillota bacterium]